MHSLRAGVSHRERAAAGSEIQEPKTGRRGQGYAAGRLRAVAAILLTLAATTPPGYAQQEGTATAPPDKAASDLPVAPVPVATQPIPLRTSDRDYSKAFGTWHGNPINIYRPTTIAKASFQNSVRLGDLRITTTLPLRATISTLPTPMFCALGPAHCRWARLPA